MCSVTCPHELHLFLKTLFSKKVSKEAGGVSLLSREVAEEVVERPNMTLTKEE